MYGPRSASTRSLQYTRQPLSTRFRRTCARKQLLLRSHDQAAALTSASPHVSIHGEKEKAPGFWSKLKDAVSPFDDSSANARFLALAIGGMLCSIATLIHDSYLPIFMRDELGMNNSKIGSVQALSQLMCQVSKSFSGVMGDLLGSQVKILMFGTFMTALSKPIFAVSQLVFLNFGAAACIWCITIGRLIDRVSKGFREAPTKALLSQTAQQVKEPADSAFSLRQSFVTIGSLAGSAAASAVFVLSGASYITTFAVAAIPPCVALAWLSFAFRSEIGNGTSKSIEQHVEPDQQQPNSNTHPKPGSDEQPTPEMGVMKRALAIIRAFSPAYWQALAVVSVLYFGRFDFAWVTLRAKACAVPKAVLPMLASVTMLATTVTAFSVGRYTKGRGVKARNIALFAGFIVLVAANACLALPATASPIGMFIACGLIGVHMGMTHGLTLSMVSSYMPHHQIQGVGNVSGTAWSFTDMILGCILAASNQLAGRLTDITVNMSLGNIGCFLGGSAAAVVAAVLLIVFSHVGDLGSEVVKSR